MFDIEHKNQLRTAQANGRGIGIPHVKRKATQRFQLARSLSETGRHETWMPWLKWHTLRDAQEQVGHSKMSTILEIYSRRSAEQRRITIEKLSVLMANDGKFA
jgi:hypothetical protein